MGSKCGKCLKKNNRKRKISNKISKLITSNVYTYYIESNFIPSSSYYKNQNKKNFLIKESVSDFRTVFIDNIFQPNKNSLINNIEIDIIEKDDKYQFDNIVWKKPSEILDGNYCLYDKIEIDNIIQGNIGDCYFLCAVSVLALKPDRIKNKIIINNKKEKDEIYTIRLYIQGKEKIIYVDDYLPYLISTKSWAFCSNLQNEIWSQILEKAWAKINLSYNKISSGSPLEALSALTPAPVYTYAHELITENRLWEIFMDSDKKNYLICVTSDELHDSESRGIVVNHGYSILKIYEIKDLKLIKIRNPWGKFIWSGDYSDSSSKWTRQLKLLTEMESKNDGTFFMQFSDFKKYFKFSFVCKYHEDYIYEYKKISQDEKNSLVCVKLNLDNYVDSKKNYESRTSNYFTLHCKQLRFYSNKNPSYKLQVSCLILFSKNKTTDEIIYHDSTFANDEKIIIESDIIKFQSNQDYFLLANVYWPYCEKKLNLIISTYANNKIGLDHVKSSDLPKDYLIMLLKSYLNKKASDKIIFQDKVNNKICNENVEITTNLEIFNNINFAVCSFKNTSKKNSMCITLFINYDQSKLLYVSCSEFEVKDKIIKKDELLCVQSIIKPDDEKLIFFKMNDIRKNCIIDITDIRCEFFRNKKFND